MNTFHKRPRWRRTWGIAFVSVLALGCTEMPTESYPATSPSTAPRAESRMTTVHVFSQAQDGGFVGATVVDGDVIAEDAVIGSIAEGSRFRALLLSAYPDSSRTPTVQADGSREGTRTEQRGYCWYLITYNIETGEIVDEELLWCDGASNPCDATQVAIAQEYDDYDTGARQQPNCDDVEYNGDRSVYFSWDELNGYWQEGNPHDRYGWVQQTLKTNLDALRVNWGGAIPLSSGYRCPHGNASIPGASRTSWHLEGRAGDISVKSLAGVSSNWDGMTAAERQRVRQIWDDLDGIADGLNALDTQPFEEYADRHYHAAW